uniref:Uncharacterized protein n=1 Tax=Anguilla anguilla TaxID=7936 RepID=A0A0E9TIW8_ANGAN
MSFMSEAGKSQTCFSRTGICSFTSLIHISLSAATLACTLPVSPLFMVRQITTYLAKLTNVFASSLQHIHRIT